ncbi:aminotransferase class V-fold PLP-dependent enzyme [Sphingomonas glacialis]|uniref:Aminotransferase class V-fold PLP-dependent enzyme n=1 Tax=Sphingomonas glacialis TaxID=658225 RepID=A0A502FRT2_9SPHN|nr:aminotransferase class V-fold PLP-dependent enzyme [Sphingomonas glacialis]TPG52165.1 aminotransferase class V-fold PLP-dependent enzyme [Sphingomonas glacialis]
MPINRRTMMIGATSLPVAARLGAAPLAGGARADDEAYWATVAAHYDVTSEVIQLENGNWGIMARPVLAAYERAVERVNRENSFYSRRAMGADLHAVRVRVAAALGVGADEIALTRNATEALQALIDGYNRLRPGDAVLYADLDYDSMQGCFAGLRARRGVDVVKIALPEPATWQGLIDAYAQAFDANPKVRLVLLTHLSHRTGLVVPVREIVAMARARGIDAIVDAAHSWGQLDFEFPELGVDFAGFNLHKWMGAPLGVGVMYLRKTRVRDIDPDPANGIGDPDDVQARVHTGTGDYAAQLTVPDALAFQEAIGAAPRDARLRLLRDRWAEPLRAVKSVQILTPADPRLHGGITSFRFTGKVSPADNSAIAKRLLDDFRIFTVHRTGVAAGSCVRVTPALFTTPQQIDALIMAIRGLA